MILELTEVKDYLKLESDYTLEDNLLTMFLKASEGYLETAVDADVLESIKTNEKKLAKAKIFCLALITEWYENRMFSSKQNATTSVSEQTRLVIQILATQLIYG